MTGRVDGQLSAKTLGDECTARAGRRPSTDSAGLTTRVSIGLAKSLRRPGCAV